MNDSGNVPLDDVAIFDALYPGLCRFAAVVRPPGVDSEDLVQEALARTLAVRPLRSLEFPQAYLRTAIVHVAANLARSRRRARARDQRAVPTDAAMDPYPSDLADLMRVEPRARAVLYLTIVEGEPYRSAAAVVGCSEVAARALASRALRSLQVELAGELETKESS